VLAALDTGAWRLGAGAWVPAGLQGEDVVAMVTAGDVAVALTADSALRRCVDATAPAPVWEPLPTRSDAVTRIAGAGTEIVAATAGATVLRLVGDAWQAVADLPGAPASITALELDADGTIWAATDRTLYGMAPSGAWTAAPLGDVGALHVLGTGARGELLVAADVGLLRRTANAEWSRLPVDPAVDVAAIAAGPDGTIWIGSGLRPSLSVAASDHLASDPAFSGLASEPRDIVTDGPML
jgi:hypothetical protein